jgi:hypothetical protein
MIQRTEEGGGTTSKTTEGDIVRLRRGENKVASDLVDAQGLTSESAKAILKTRVLNPSILGLVLSALTKKQVPPIK